jgi:hypothetical protein
MTLGQVPAESTQLAEDRGLAELREVGRFCQIVPVVGRREGIEKCGLWADNPSEEGLDSSLSGRISGPV